MNNKLKLAIASFILLIIVKAVLYKFRPSFNDGLGFGLRDSLSFLTICCVLGTIPFLFSFIRGDKNILLHKNNNTESGNKDEDWVKHLLVRIGLILGFCLGFYCCSFLGGGMDVAYLVMYGIIATLAISFIVLIVEAVILVWKKKWYKLFINLTIIGMLFFFVLQLL